MDSKSDSKTEPKSLEQLRAMARAAGLRGYSSLRKQQLIELLGKAKTRSSARPPTQSVPKKTARPKTVRAAMKKNAPAVATHRVGARGAAPATTAEERIERAKFETAPTGSIPAPALASTLYEDIDRLPALGEPVLCLLPQKPGVVHAYWVLQAGAPTTHLRLRLCLVSGDTVEIVEEIKLPGERGHWYFQIADQSEAGNYLAHLGYYDAQNQFVTAIRRGIARIPGLHASARTDRSWWISDADFHAMYLRAGGVVRGKRLHWPGSASSRHR